MEDKRVIEEPSEKYIVSEKLVADYIAHLTGIETRKEKRRTDNDRKRAERKQQENNQIDWEDLYHRNQSPSLRVGNLNFALITTILHLKERKMRK